MGTNKQSICSLFILFFYGLLAGSSYDTTDFLFILIVIIIVAVVVFIFEDMSKEKEFDKLQNEKLNKKNENKQKFLELKSKFGTFTNIINYDYSQFVLLNENTSIIIINEHKYHFKDILNFSISDHSSVIYSPTSSTTTTNTGSMLGRAAVGGILTGGVGAVIGGATGSKTTTTSGGTSKTMHSYSIIVTVNSLSSPIEKIQLKGNEEKTNEIAAILNIIISRGMNYKPQSHIEEMDFYSSEFYKSPTYSEEEVKRLVDEHMLLKAVAYIRENTDMTVEEARDYVNSLSK